MMTRGVVEREGNALPTHSGHICAILSNLLHEVPSCRVAENGLDGELTLEVMSPGIFLPPHLGPN